jgi:hypothetical protein
MQIPMEFVVQIEGHHVVGQVAEFEFEIECVAMDCDWNRSQFVVAESVVKGWCFGMNWVRIGMLLAVLAIVASVRWWVVMMPLEDGQAVMEWEWSHVQLVVVAMAAQWAAIWFVAALVGEVEECSL